MRSLGWGIWRVSFHNSFLQNRFEKESEKGLQGLLLPNSEIELAYFIEFKRQLVIKKIKIIKKNIF